MQTDENIVEYVHPRGSALSIAVVGLPIVTFMIVVCAIMAFDKRVTNNAAGIIFVTICACVSILALCGLLYVITSSLKFRIVFTKDAIQRHYVRSVESVTYANITEVQHGPPPGKRLRGVGRMMVGHGFLLGSGGSIFFIERFLVPRPGDGPRASGPTLLDTLRARLPDDVDADWSDLKKWYARPKWMP